MSIVRWGILSSSNFAQTKVIPALLKSNQLQVLGIASRDAEKARALSSKFGFPKSYSSYEELLGDPEIEVVYIPTPNHLHVDLSIKALEAGKHVLCEKPIGLNAKDAERLAEASRRFPQQKVMEAFMYRLHPQWRKTVQLVRDGAIGKLITVQSFFSYFNEDPKNIRNNPEIGGGALMDIGCYNVSLSRLLFDSEPRRVVAKCEVDPRFGTDRLTTGILEFSSGTASFTCATQSSSFQRVLVMGTRGQVEIEIPFNAPPDRECRIWLRQEGKEEEIRFEICDQYSIEAEEFSAAVRGQTEVPTPFADAISNMKTIDALFESSRTGGWIYLE